MLFANSTLPTIWHRHPAELHRPARTQHGPGHACSSWGRTPAQPARPHQAAPARECLASWRVTRGVGGWRGVARNERSWLVGGSVCWRQRRCGGQGGLWGAAEAALGRWRLQALRLKFGACVPRGPGPGGVAQSFPHASAGAAQASAEGWGSGSGGSATSIRQQPILHLVSS